MRFAQSSHGSLRILTYRSTDTSANPSDNPGPRPAITHRTAGELGHLPGRSGPRIITVRSTRTDAAVNDM
jgi:hypothetical protein